MMIDMEIFNVHFGVDVIISSFFSRLTNLLVKKEKLIIMNSKGPLMRIKRMFRNLKPDYEIFLWIKSFDCTETTQYKNKSQLLREFKQATIKRKKKTQAKKYQPYQKKHQTNSESEQINTELNQLISTRQQLLEEESYTLKSPCYQPKSPSASV
ncbi:hypothetical protein C2G38_2283406 [Gigaspora rosea]|uniref:Uncharacterized protein n=1 Tax=Gigaspora rosea TaxID=44941 RepID=A0A397VZR5_9GLOM|nr:hypothetical protein C2G38_2283406 [Gigaspora rosea]